MTKFSSAIPLVTSTGAYAPDTGSNSCSIPDVSFCFRRQWAYCGGHYWILMFQINAHSLVEPILLLYYISSIQSFFMSESGKQNTCLLCLQPLILIASWSAANKKKGLENRSEEERVRCRSNNASHCNQAQAIYLTIWARFHCSFGSFFFAFQDSSYLCGAVFLVWLLTCSTCFKIDNSYCCACRNTAGRSRSCSKSENNASSQKYICLHLTADLLCLETCSWRAKRVPLQTSNASNQVHNDSTPHDYL